MKNLRNFRKYLGLFSGCLLAATGIALFLRPANIFAGGIPGIAIILINVIGETYSQYLGFIVFGLQIIFIIIQLIFGGRMRMLKGMLTAFTMSSLIQIITYLTLDVIISDNALLMALTGAALMGGGIGVVLDSGFNFAGTVGVAELISKKLNISPGKILIYFESVFLVAGTFFIGIEKALISVLAIFVVGQAINYVTFGMSHYKNLMIISPNTIEIRESLEKDVSHHMSIIKTEPLSLHEPQEILMVLIRHDLLRRVQDIIRSVDPEAMIIAFDVDNMIGGKQK